MATAGYGTALEFLHETVAIPRVEVQCNHAERLCDSRNQCHWRFGCIAAGSFALVFHEYVSMEDIINPWYIIFAMHTLLLCHLLLNHNRKIWFLMEIKDQYLS